MGDQTSGSMGPLAREVADLIRRYSTLADAILTTQCRLSDCSPDALKTADLAPLIPLITNAVGRFTSPIKATKLEAELQMLQRRLRRQEASPRRPFSVTRQPSFEPKPDRLTHQVLQILGDYTPFGGQIFNAQCKSIGVDPGTIRLEDLEALIPKLSARVGQWTSPIKGESVERQLRRLQNAHAAAYGNDAENATKAPSR